MPATTTTAIDTPFQSLGPTPYATTQPVVTTVTPRTYAGITSTPTNVVVTRVTTNVPIKRWNGSAWVSYYKPRI